jgi:hypothetical protein
MLASQSKLLCHHIKNSSSWDNVSHWVNKLPSFMAHESSLPCLQEPGTRLYSKSLIHSIDFNSNKSPTRCNSFPFYYPDVYLQLNKFRTFSRPSSGAQWLHWQPLVLPSYRGDICAVCVVGPVITGPTTNTARLSLRYEDETRGCHCTHWAPDDGRENARNMLSCKQTSG